jgi:Flp pilus assembly protein CpaB
MKNLEFLHKYYPLIVRYRRSIAATLAGLGTLIALSIVIPSPGSQTKVLVATGALSAGTTLTASDFTQKTLPDDLAWSTCKQNQRNLLAEC